MNTQKFDCTLMCLLNLLRKRLLCSVDSVFVPLISFECFQMRMIASLWIVWRHTTRLFVLQHMKNIYQKLYMI